MWNKKYGTGQGNEQWSKEGRDLIIWKSEASGRLLQSKSEGYREEYRSGKLKGKRDRRQNKRRANE